MACCAGSGGPAEYREFPQHPSRSASECRGVRRCGVHSRWRAAWRRPAGASLGARRRSVSTRRVPHPVGYPVPLPCTPAGRGDRDLPARRAAAVPRRPHPDGSRVPPGAPQQRGADASGRARLRLEPTPQPEVPSLPPCRSQPSLQCNVQCSHCRVVKSRPSCVLLMDQFRAGAREANALPRRARASCRCTAPAFAYVGTRIECVAVVAVAPLQCRDVLEPWRSRARGGA